MKKLEIWTPPFLPSPGRAAPCSHKMEPAIPKIRSTNYYQLVHKDAVLFGYVENTNRIYTLIQATVLSLPECLTTLPNGSKCRANDASMPFAIPSDRRLLFVTVLAYYIAVASAARTNATILCFGWGLLVPFEPVEGEFSPCKGLVFDGISRTWFPITDTALRVMRENGSNLVDYDVQLLWHNGHVSRSVYIHILYVPPTIGDTFLSDKLI